MRNFYCLRLIPLLCLSTLLNAAIAQNLEPRHAVDEAMTEELLDTQKAFYEDWYQIEVIVFERRFQASSNEVWPKNIFLAYPYQIQFLQTQEEWELAKKIEEELVELDEYGNPVKPSLTRQQNRNTAENGQGQNNFASNNVKGDNFQAGNTSTDIDKQNYVEQNPLDSETDDLAFEIPFIKLGPEQQNLASEARRLSSNNQYRILFHEAWRQPLESSKQADAILITGGDRYGDHFELEGNIELSVNRFLHINTNLWLSQFEANYGQESEHWPALPQIPSKTPKEGADPELKKEFGFNFGTASEPVKPTSFSFSKQENNNSIFSQGFEISSNEPVIDSPFLQKQVILVQQGRKMRSSELHHLDHPRLGLLIKITKHAPFKESKEPLNKSKYSLRNL